MSGCAAGQRWRFEQLSHAYECLESGSCPSVSAGTLASILFAGAAEGSGGDGEAGEAGDPGPGSSLELTCLSLTLVRKLTSSLMARGLPPAVASYFLETLQNLIDEMDLMSHLVRVFLQVSSET